MQRLKAKRNQIECPLYSLVFYLFTGILKFWIIINKRKILESDLFKFVLASGFNVGGIKFFLYLIKRYQAGVASRLLAKLFYFKNDLWLQKCK